MTRPAVVARISGRSQHSSRRHGTRHLAVRHRGRHETQVADPDSSNAADVGISAPVRLASFETLIAPAGDDSDDRSA
jgi:hypothetical protein